MSSALLRATALTCVSLATISFVAAGDNDEHVSKLEAAVRRQHDLITELRAQLAHERTAENLKYEMTASPLVPDASPLKKGSLWSGIGSQGGTVAFRVVSTSGSDVFLESVGSVPDRVLLRFSCVGQNLQLRSLWLKGVDCRQVRWAGSGVVTGNTADLKYSYTFNGATKDQAVFLTHEVMITDLPR